MSTKEEFCGLCAAAPLALLGAGAELGSNVGDKEKNKKRRKYLFWTGLVSILLSIIIIVYYSFNGKKCTKCFKN
jgi:formate hydrogenlyase subunit 3/multisubunit Na+/H+ antiporter MnhD subunit